MKTWQWSKRVVVALPVVLALGMPGCTEEMCPTAEDKAIARANGWELVESDDCIAEESEEAARDAHDSDMSNKSSPGLEPEYLLNYSSDDDPVPCPYCHMGGCCLTHGVGPCD